jgi:hypothetical protein
VGRVWVIRGGDDNRLVDDFVAAGVIGVGYPDVPDGRTVDRWDVTEILRLRGWTGPESRAEMFEQFVRVVGVGDVVVMPDTPRREVVIGRVEGEYEFAGHLPVEEYRHRHPVTWLGRHGIDLLPAAHRDVYKQRTTLTERSSAVLLDHADAVERGELGRDARDTAPAARPPRRAATKAPSVPKARSVPKTPASSGRACPGCYLIKSDSLFPGGSEVCVDCT